ncbi:MAG: sulfatase-like hydrolase/transferase, partial [Anaerolineae bacterium]|nr:sulfatase-like hydrolase/transferase [Anaerolineae bacterium]
MPANILMITCDQLRQDSLGCYDNPAIRTPYIDALAARGVRFDNAYTAYPVCAPNRASLVTGRYPSINGLRHNGIFLPRFELTLMEVLRQRGYQTYGAGKMHFGPQWKWPPDGGPLQDPTPALAVNPQPEPWELPWHGFDCITITEDHRVGPYEAYLNANGYDIWQDPHSFSYPQHQCVRSAWPEERHQTTWIGDRAVEFLACHPENRPFFIWASFVHPHHPFNPPAPYDTMYAPADMPLPVFDEAEVACWPEAYRNKYFATEGGHEAIGMHLIADAEWQRIRAYYYGMISLIDKQVGRMVEMLRERKLLDNTIILFTSDHGEMLGDHHLVFKGTTYDEVTRVPLIVALPGAPRPTGAR